MILYKLGLKKDKIWKVGAETPPRQKTSGGVLTLSRAVWVPGLGSLAASAGTVCFTYQRGKKMLLVSTPFKPTSGQLCTVSLAIGTTSQAIAVEASGDELRRQTR